MIRNDPTQTILHGCGQSGVRAALQVGDTETLEEKSNNDSGVAAALFKAYDFMIGSQ